MVKGSVQGVDPLVWEASQEIASALAEASCADELGQFITDALDRMVSCDLGSILTAAPGQEWSIAGEISDNRLLKQNYWRYAAEMSNAELERLAGSFSLATHVFPLRRRERLAVFQEFLNPNGLLEVAVGTWVADGRLWGIGLARTESSFSEQDLTRLNAILPLLRAALRAARWLGREDLDAYPGAGLGGPWALTPSQERTMSGFSPVTQRIWRLATRPRMSATLPQAIRRPFESTATRVASASASSR